MNTEKKRISIYKTANQIKWHLIQQKFLQPVILNGLPHYRHLSDLLPSILYAFSKVDEFRNKDNQKESVYIPFMRKYWLTRKTLPKSISMPISDFVVFEHFLKKGIIFQDLSFKKGPEIIEEIEPFFWAEKEDLNSWNPKTRDG